jgi:hypothetical protein
LGPTPPYFANGSKSSSGFAGDFGRDVDRGTARDDDCLRHLAKLFTRSAAPFVDTRCRFDNLVTA